MTLEEKRMKLHNAINQFGLTDLRVIDIDRDLHKDIVAEQKRIIRGTTC